MKPEHPTILLGARWESGLVAMVAWSFLLHVLVALAVLAVSRSAGRRERPALAYTVELTNLASLGSSGGAFQKAEPEAVRKKKPALAPSKRQPAVKKAPAKKTVVKKPVPKHPAPKKTVAKKRVPKKAVAKKVVPKPPAPKAAVAAKPPPKASPANKPGPKEAPAVATAKPEKAEKSPEGPDARYLAAIDRVRRRLEPGGSDGSHVGPASAGGGDDGGGNRVVGAEFLIYYNIMISSIRRGWLWVGHERNLAVTVRFGITEDGEIRSLVLDRSSGNAGYDHSVLRAVHEASPLPPPPLEYKDDFSRVQLTFRPGDLRAPDGNARQSD